MNQNSIEVPEVRETQFFSDVAGRLRQWLMVTIENPTNRLLPGVVTVVVGGEEATTRLDLAPGSREYRCYAPALWPHHPPTDSAAVRVEAGGYMAVTLAPVGHHRPWTVYLLSDVCTDYVWAYERTENLRADDAAVTAAELAAADATRDGPEANRNHYNFVHAREIEFFLQHYPDQAERLFDAIRQGTLQLNPFHNMVLTSDVTVEELIRQMYPARRWANEQGLDIGYANLQETPTAAWIVPTVLANSGVRYLVKSILPYECPWAARLEEPPLFAWEGPDGSRVLVRWRNKDYVEGRFVLQDLRAANTALHESILPGYEQLGGDYPFGVIALVGCYGDLAPTSCNMPARKVATIAAYNAQGWDYPRLVNASHKQFWGALEVEMAERGLELEVIRGDYGSAWDVWPASLAFDLAGWRRAQERAATADRLAAIASRLDPAAEADLLKPLAEGWQNLVHLADHAWNGASEGNRILNAGLRRKWQVAANDAFDGVVARGIVTLTRRVRTQAGRHVLVLNDQGWMRDGLATIEPGIGVVGEALGELQAVDLATGQTSPVQALDGEGKPGVCFLARNVPSVGYRVYRLETGGDPSDSGPRVDANANSLESPYYRLEVSSTTGAIVSLFDKQRGRELVDQDSPYHLNQCLYWSEGAEYTPKAAAVERLVSGPVLGQLTVRASLKHTQVRTTITLYTGLDRVDIRNEVEKLVTVERQELDFAFPVAVPRRQYRFEAPGAILEPGSDQRPGSGQAVTAVRHFVDVFNDEFGVTLSQADSGLVEFGHRTTLEDPQEPDPSNSTLLALAMENCVDWHEAVRDQGGATLFVFRYSLRGHQGGFDPVQAVRFGAEDNHDLLAVALPSEQDGDLPADAHSFIRVKPAHVVLTGVKLAEEDGLIVRLWECAGEAVQASVVVDGLGTLAEASATDLLERDAGSLPVSGGEVTIETPARGLATLRLLFD